MHGPVPLSTVTHPTTLLELLAGIVAAKRERGMNTDYPPLPKKPPLLLEDRKRDQDLLAQVIAKRRSEGKECDEWTFVLEAYGNNPKTASLGYSSLLYAVAPEITAACKHELELPE